MWYVARRGALLVPILLIVSFLVFASVHLEPGSPVEALVGDQPLSVATIHRLNAEYGFDQPLWTQYWRFLDRALHGDFGYSYRYNLPIWNLVVHNLRPTGELLGTSLLFGIVLGSVLGIIAALRAGSFVDTGVTFLATVGLSLPGFWFGLLLLYWFSVDLHLFPTIGADGLKSLVLPSITLGVILAASIARFMRSSLIEVMQQDYITTARSKGVPEHVVVLRHALRNASAPLLSIIGLQAGVLFAGAVIVEHIFTRPGIGSLLVNGIENRDFPVIQGTILLVAAWYVLLNLFIDVAYALADPRIRHSARPW